MWFCGYFVVVLFDFCKFSKNVLNIYDLKNKFVVYNSLIGEVVYILCEWGIIMVFI